MTVEYVDVLAPPNFEPTGQVKPVIAAINDGDWLGVMNLWIVRPGPALLYQERPDGGWEPRKFDGSVGGYYRAGETGLDGLREVEEELGWKCPTSEITLIGRHLSVGVDSLGRQRRLVVTVYMTYCDLPLSTFKLDPKEVPALYEIAADDVLNVFANPARTFEAHGVTFDGRAVSKWASVKDFSYVFGGYHPRIAAIAKQFANGERTFCY
jgi:hypothetical protein